MSNSAMPIRRFFDAIFQEPLIPFAVIGGILFAVYGFKQPVEIETIEITPQTLRALENLEIDLRGRPLSDDEQNLLVESFIEDEVLMREAFRRGLEKKDPRVRKRLLNVMRESLDEPIAEPSSAQLQQYYQQKIEDYDVAEACSFDQVYFSFGSEPNNDQALLTKLNGGAEHTQLGEQHFAGRTVQKMQPNEMRRMFGNQMTVRLLSQELGVWEGPIESRDGTHYVRIVKKERMPRPTFEQMQEYLRQDWMFKQRRDVQTKKIAEMKKGYRIVLKDEGGRMKDE